MNRAIAAGLIVASLALAGPAGAATPTERRLTRQVTALQKEVAALKKQVRELDLYDGALTAVVFCSAAITADAFQGTWTTIDQVAGRSVVPAQQTVNDSGTCNAVRVPRTAAAPPGLASFHAMMGLLAFRPLFGAVRS